MSRNRTLNLNGTIYATSNLISTSNRAFQYGDAVFETIRFDEQPLFWPDHYVRLLKAAALLGFDWPEKWSEDFFRYELVKTAKHNRFNSGRIRLTIFRQDGGFYRPLNDRCAYLIVYTPDTEGLYPLKSTFKIGVFEDHLKYADDLSAVKTANALLYVLAARKASKQDWDEALILNHHKEPIESSSGNLWMVTNQMVITPPLEAGPIDGIMRKQILRLMTQYQIPFEERIIRKHELKIAQEIWISNCIRGIQPVSHFDDLTFDNQVALQLRNLINIDLKEKK